MQSVYQQTSPNTAQPPRAACLAGDQERLLHAIWWLSRHWVEHLAVNDPSRETLIHLGLLSDDLVRAGDYSPAAMAAVRFLLCANCHRLDAAQGKCSGKSLDRCTLLNTS